ncbi:MAG: hypothetical protein ACD_69C00362G0007 [uncultured bacterium]|nr:MAG: hypothetical protein ACD_69C00362G0007 [uncultured bacterium]
MKYLIASILIFTTTCCFAIGQKLIDGAEKYDVAVKNLSKIEGSIAVANESLKYWSNNLDEAKNSRNLSDDIIQFYQDKIYERNKQLNDLGIQYNEANEIVKKLEPAKAAYDKQEEKERKWNKFETKISNIAGMSIMPLGFVLILWISIRQQKKYKRLLKEGKITQEEFDRMTQSSHTFSNGAVNPATGLPMTGVGISDVGGNIRGSSSSYDSMRNASQEHRDRHRWD